MITADSETTNTLRQGDITFISLLVTDVERASNFYSNVLGWSLSDADARSGSRLVQGQSLPQGLANLEATAYYFGGMGLKIPPDLAPGGYVTLAVDDLDAAVARVRAQGGQATNPAQSPYGRLAQCLDDQGLMFALQQQPAGQRPLPSGSRSGDVAYLVFESPDSSRARAFYGEVLGWQFSPGRVQDGWNVADVVPMSGMAGGRPRARIIPMFRVDDIQTSVQRVRAAGGTSTDPAVQPYGTSAECTDDQGTTFYLGQF